MASRLCPGCRSPLHAKATKCPHCGASTRGRGGGGVRRRRRGPVRAPASAKRDTNLIWMWLGLGVAAVIVVVTYLSFAETDNLRREKRMKQELQMQEKNRSGTPR